MGTVEVCSIHSQFRTRTISGELGYHKSYLVYFSSVAVVHGEATSGTALCQAQGMLTKGTGCCEDGDLYPYNPDDFRFDSSEYDADPASLVNWPFDAHRSPTFPYDYIGPNPPVDGLDESTVAHPNNLDNLHRTFDRGDEDCETLVAQSNYDSDCDMAENVQPAPSTGAAANGDQSGMARYEAQRQHLKELIHNRRLLDRQLAMQEQTILQKETEYLESTASGNILTGFDGYIKGGTSAAAVRKRTGLIDQNRVFSRSSLSYNPQHPENSEPQSATSTPAAPTPLSTSFANKDKDSGSNQPTPTSATEKKATKSTYKKKKKDADGEDSETDSREVKKIRTHFGAARK